MNAFCVVEGQVIKQLQFLEWFWISEMSSDNSLGPDLKQAFVTSTLLTFGLEKFFGVCVCVCSRGRSLVHCKIFSSISGLYTLDASSTLPTPHLSQGKTKNVSISCQMSLKITYHFRLKTAALK